MLEPGYEMFLQKPSNASRHALLPMQVLRVENEVCIVELDELAAGLENDLDVVVYFEHNRRFMKQAARIQSILLEDDALPQMIIEPTGKPIDAESRQCYRVSTVMNDRTVLFNHEICPLLDVSATGYAVMTSQELKIGQQTQTVLAHNNQSYAGMACVQSIQVLDNQRTRYGMHCMEHGHAKNKLAAGLHQLNMATQREQLRRMSRKTG